MFHRRILSFVAGNWENSRNLWDSECQIREIPGLCDSLVKDPGIRSHLLMVVALCADILRITGSESGKEYH